MPINLIKRVGDRTHERQYILYLFPMATVTYDCSLVCTALLLVTTYAKAHLTLIILTLRWGAYVRDKNTLARLCAKKAGGCICGHYGNIDPDWAMRDVAIIGLLDLGNP